MDKETYQIHTNIGDNMKKQSLWDNTYIMSQDSSGSIKNNTSVDVLIIGGGIAGMSTMMELRNSKRSIALIEKNTIGSGITSKTTGKITFQQGTIYSELWRQFDFFSAYLYYRSQKDAIEIIKNRVHKFQIDCDLEKADSYLFAEQEAEITKIKKEEAFYKKASIPFEQVEFPITYPTKYVVKVTNTYTFHPLKYLDALKQIILKKGHQIYEHTMAYSVTKDESGYIVKTNKGEIHATDLVIATHYPFFIVPGFIPLKTYIEKSYLLATKVDKNEHFQAINVKKPITSMRYWNEDTPYFIYGGESAETTNIINPVEKKEMIKEKFHSNIMKEEIDYLWEAHDVMSDDKLPIIGSVNKENEHLYLITGFSKWGMTNGTIAGRIISDMILNKENVYQKIFSPERKNLPRFLSSIKHGIETSSAYFLAKLKKRQEFYDKHVEIIYENGKRIGVYIDQFQNRHYVSNVCPHMKCNLIFNPNTLTWDCPCHGSSFDIHGNVLTGPSTESIHIDKR